MKKRLIRYSITVGIGVVLVVLYLYLQEFSNAETQKIQLRMLADAFTISGVILILPAGLIWVASDGFFDGLTYSARRLARLIPFTKLKDERYYDYKMRKRENRPQGYGFIFFTGLGFFLVAVIMIALFYLI